MSAPVVVMVTVADRAPLLTNFLVSYAEHGPGWPVAIHLQGPADAPRASVPAGVEIAHWRHSPEPLGCHAARVELLRDLAHEGFLHYVNVDDDVQLTEHTRWQPAVDFTATPGTGFVLTNWARHQAAYDRVVPTIEEAFPRQVMVYNGGGMVYTDAVADLMRGLDPVPARYDDIWPLTAYLAGYRNHRYRGSLALHTTLRKGGMQRYMRAEPRPLLCWEHIDYRWLPGRPVGDDYAIPADADLRPGAHAAHRAARSERGWAVR